MISTDELRRLLDELGVGHEDMDTEIKGGYPKQITVWGKGTINARFEEWSNGTVRFMCGNITPEQAIEATLADHRYDDKVIEILNDSNDHLIYENAKLRELVRDFYPFASGRAANPWLSVRLERMRELGV